MAAQEEGRRPEGQRPASSRTSSVATATDDWADITLGWAQSGHTMPRPGSRAFRCLAEDDPVRRAALLAAAHGLAEEVRRDGPSAARALKDVA